MYPLCVRFWRGKEVSQSQLLLAACLSHIWPEWEPKQDRQVIEHTMAVMCWAVGEKSSVCSLLFTHAEQKYLAQVQGCWPEMTIDTGWGTVEREVSPYIQQQSSLENILK